MRLEKIDNGYQVFDDTDAFVGLVYRIQKPSRIRRGRMQVSPWWRPIRRDGQPVRAEWSGMEQDYVARRDAVKALLR